MQRGRESKVGSRAPACCSPSQYCPRSPAFDLRPENAFTLLEIMMVVAIIGLMMSMGVPAILRTMHEEPLRKAVNDVMNICSHARAQAILYGVTTTVIFHPRSGDVALASLASTNPPAGSLEDNPHSGDAQVAAPNAAALNSTHFGNGVVLDMLDINFTEYKDADEARVRFFPNGTCDGMTLILHSGDQYREISLEVTTGLAYLKVIH